MTTLSGFSTEELRLEISERERVARDQYWADRIHNAKYLCSDCGMPDSNHTVDCPSDAET